MRKEVFLEYKFGDYSIDVLRDSGANGFIVWMDGLNQKRLADIQSLNVQIGLSFSAFTSGDCPLNPEAKFYLKKRIDQAVKYNPKVIILDHFRFDGHWCKCHPSNIMAHFCHD